MLNMDTDLDLPRGSVKLYGPAPTCTSDSNTHYDCSYFNY